ncbi:MAG: hypothetical protein ACM3S1_04210 [Hyphomicrobiales bacterium]
MASVWAESVRRGLEEALDRNGEPPRFPFARPEVGLIDAASR